MVAYDRLSLARSSSDRVLPHARVLVRIDVGVATEQRPVRWPPAAACRGYLLARGVARVLGLVKLHP